MQKTSSKSSVQRIEKIRHLVDRGFELNLQINALTEELKTVKNRLKAEAIIHPTERTALVDATSDGQQWIGTGTQSECRIIFPAPRLISEISAEHRDLTTIRALTQEKFSFLFRESVTFQPADKGRFRELVGDCLSAAAASQVLLLCTTPSEPRTLWKPNSPTVVA